MVVCTRLSEMGAGASPAESQRVYEEMSAIIRIYVCRSEMCSGVEPTETLCEYTPSPCTTRFSVVVLDK